MSPKKALLRAWFLLAKKHKRQVTFFWKGSWMKLVSMIWKYSRNVFLMPGCSCSLLSYFTFFEADGFFFFKTHLHRWVETPGDVKKKHVAWELKLQRRCHVHPDWGFFSVCLPVETRDTNWVFETWAQFPGASRFLLFGFSVEWRWTIQDDSHGPMDDLFRFFGGVIVHSDVKERI